MFEVSRMIRAWDEDGALGPPRHAFCRRHGQFCQVAPHQNRQEDRLYVHCAGVVCIDWSCRGKQRGWGGPSAAAFSQWVVERLLADDDIIIMECTPRFNVDQGLRQTLGHKYDVHPLVFSPSDLGFPLKRQRLYALLLRRGRVSAPPNRDLRELFWSLFPRQTLLPGCAFFRAPQEPVNALRRRMAHRRHLPPKQTDGSPWPFQALLTPGLARRKQIHRKLVQKLATPSGGLPDATCGAQPDLEERPPARKRKAGQELTGGSQANRCHQLCVDISHQPPFSKASRDLPTLCQNSVVWSFDHSRPMLGTEKWEAMGLPVWSAECGFPHPWETLVPGMRKSRQGGLCPTMPSGQWLAMPCTWVPWALSSCGHWGAPFPRWAAGHVAPSQQSRPPFPRRAAGHAAPSQQPPSRPQPASQRRSPRWPRHERRTSRPGRCRPQWT